jgi:PAS domain S-box-containing protein
MKTRSDPHHAIEVEAIRPLGADELASLFDQASVIVAVKDLTGRYVYLNRPFAELFDTSIEAILGKTDQDLFPAAMAERLRTNDQTVLDQGTELAFEERLSIGGQQRVYLTRKLPHVDARGRAVGVALMATDITRESRTEQALESIALSVSAATGPEVFDLIVEALAGALEVELAFIATLIDEVPQRLGVLSAWHLDRLIEPPCYEAAGTPCDDVMGSGPVYISGDLQQTHPGDPMVFDYGFNSYAGYPLKDTDDRVIGVLSVCHSGTLPERSIVEHLLHIFSVRACAELARAQTEAALRHSEASYRAIFESAEDSIFVHDMDSGEIIDVNRKACTTYGYSRAELLRLDVAQLSSGIPPYTGDMAAHYIAAARDGIPQRFEWHRRNKDGSLHWDEVTLNRVTLSGVDRILAFTREITERKEREAAILRSENRLRAMITSALDSIITMDTGGRIVGFNPAAEACFGWTEAEARGRSLAELIIPEAQRKAHALGLERYLRTGRGNFVGRRVELTALKRDGSEFPVELAIAMAQDRDGEVFIGYLRDISERRAAEQERLRLEAQLRQAQKMEAIGHLAGGIAHDFNNILTGVIGYLKLGRQRAGKLNQPELIRYLEQASSSADRATELIRQLLTFSRGRGGSPEPLDLSRIVQRCTPLLRATLPSSLSLEFQLESNLPPIFMDPVQAEQVLLNLCINARDAMDGQGQIVIRTRFASDHGRRCAACQKTLSGKLVELCVSDQGPGVAPEYLERIFEPFFTTKPAGQGSGMGLAIVHGIVHESGGHIGLDCSDTGTSFRVLLPAHQGAGPDSHRGSTDRSGEIQQALTGLVLLIDDEQSVLDYMVDQLELWGLDVVPMRSPAQALAWLAKAARQPDVVISDFTMPEINGLELVSRIRAHSPELPIFLYSGYTDEIPHSELVALDLPEPLTKPVDPDRLHNLLSRFLEG